VIGCGPVGTKCARVLADYSLKAASGGSSARIRRITIRLRVPGRDFPEPEFADVTTVFAGDACVRCGTALEIYRGIEVGHISARDEVLESMHCEYLDGQASACR
jgi:prolyl-tRNA synthetase